jgi:uncharacterized protein YndB with AHSA1/START domain
MKNDSLTVKATIQIGKTTDIVYEAIVDPTQMKNYFISESSGRLEKGKKVIWKFPEFNMPFPVTVIEAKKPDSISFSWDTDGNELIVVISIKPFKVSSTIVTITEGKMDLNEAGLKWLQGNTEGWANFLACLKAWLEYGINLRKGAFDFMSKTDK